MSPSLTRVDRGTFPTAIPLLLVCLASSACGGPPRREGVTPSQAHMFSHFDRAAEVHDALVAGDLEEGRSAAEWIATHQERGSFSRWSPRLQEEMQRFATQVSLAGTLPEANRAAAQLGRTCGDCHRENQVEPRFLIGTAPPGGSGPQAEMARHVWAAERMWEGLVGPGEHAWRSGAEALRSGWLDPQEVVVNPGDRLKIRTLIQQVYELGGRAETTTDPAQQAELYGEFLNTCHECHVLTAARIR